MLKPHQLKINLLTVPYGVDKNNLTFSFAIKGHGDQTMEAVRFVFAKTLQALEAEQYVYDSAFMTTTASCGICLPDLGACLQEDQLYLCAVQIQLNDGTVSDWSKPLWFSTAHNNWNPVGVWADSPCDFCLLRKEFSLGELPQKALLQVTARSPEQIRQYIYHITCNGEFAGLGPARYGKRGDDSVLYYETIDVTPFLKQGVNCLGAACYTLQDHLFATRLVTFDQKGEKTVVFDDATDFEGLNATPIFRPEQSIGTNYFFAHGENYNGEIYPYGWDEPFYRGDFTPVKAGETMANNMTLQPYPAPVTKRFLVAADRCEFLEDGTMFVDLGKEIVGGISLTATTDTPLDITLHYGEELTEEGRVKYQMRTTNLYEEHWRLAAGENTLTSIGMKTFRYLEIEGLTDESEVEVKASAYRTEFDDRASYFTSSSELLNELYDLCKYTIKATNQNLYVDSQSRERCAYEGDVLINMLTAAGVQDCDALSRFSIDYLIDHRTWPAEYVLYDIMMVRADYEYTGDRSLIQKHYHQLKENLYLDYLDPSVGLIRNITMAGNVMDAVLVDWPMSERDGYEYNRAMFNTVLNAVHYRALSDMAYLAGVMNEQSDEKHYQSLADGLKQTMIDRLYNPEKGCFIDGLTDDGAAIDHAAQHATAFALYAGVYDSDEMQKAMADFLTGQGGIRMSVYGAHFLLEGLYNANAGQTANALLLNDDVSEGARTWAYMLDKLNATITTEAWNVVNKPNMTWSHPWGSACGAALVRGVFGIRPITPGFAEFSLHLQPYGLRYGAMQTPTVKGNITAAFDLTRQDVPVSLTATIPHNTRAHLSVLAKEGFKVTANGEEIPFVFENGRYVWQATGGEWLFEVVEVQ